MEREPARDCVMLLLCPVAFYGERNRRVADGAGLRLARRPARERLRSALRETLRAEPGGSIHLSARAWAVRGTSGGNGVS